MGRATVEDLHECQFHVWYPRFGPKFAGRAEHIKLGDDFVTYLKGDGVSVGAGTRAFGRPVTPSSSESDGEEEGGERNQAEDNQEDALRGFSELFSKIDAAVHDLGGSVMPRLNWSSPKDATWINALKTMECSNADEIVLMLKASDRISSDLDQSQGRESREESGTCSTSSSSKTTSFVLNVKKWYHFDRSREFRCFVVNEKLVGICQRYFNEDAVGLILDEQELVESIFDFFVDVVSRRIDLKSYAFDIFVKKNGNIKLVDISPCDPITNPLLFSWEELEVKAAQLDGEPAVDDAEVRTVSAEDSAVVPSEIAVFGMPYDFVAGHANPSEVGIDRLIEEVRSQDFDNQR